MTTPDVSLIIATHNRALELTKTLESMCSLDTGGVTAEWIIVDNNSSDSTRDVVESFKSKISIHYLFEPRPGKNSALNHAINSRELAEIVVFTDDDVTPKHNWLLAILESCRSHPEYDLFGGKVEVEYPGGLKSLPRWYESTGARRWALSEHYVSHVASPYPHGRYPSGPNCWVRRNVFVNGVRYREDVGPTTTRRIMGSETSFFIDCLKAGHRLMYEPSAVVAHRVSEQLLSYEGLLRKSEWNGRWMARKLGPTPRTLYQKNIALWSTLRRASSLRHRIVFLLANLIPLEFCKGVRVNATRGFTFDDECVALARELRENYRPADE